MSKFKIGDKITFCGYNSFTNEIGVDEENYKCLDNRCNKECYVPHVIISKDSAQYDWVIDFTFDIESGLVTANWPERWFRLYEEPIVKPAKSRFELIGD